MVLEDEAVKLLLSITGTYDFNSSERVEDRCSSRPVL
jgi:hypothetical protein